MAKPRQKQQKVGIDSVKRNNTTPILMGVAGVVIVALIAAIIVAAVNKKDPANDSNATEFQPVTTVGTALAAEYSDPNSQTLNPCVGCQAPELQGKSFYGDNIDVKADGKSKVLVFFAHWCPHCQREVPLLSKWLQSNMKKYPNVEFYGVATASSPTKPNFPPSAWLKRESWPTPVIADDNSFDAANSYGLGAYPYIVALDGQNKVLARTSGELSTTDFENSIVKVAQSGVAPAATTTPTTTGASTNAATGKS